MLIADRQIYYNMKGIRTSYNDIPTNIFSTQRWVYGFVSIYALTLPCPIAIIGMPIKLPLNRFWFPTETEACTKLVIEIDNEPLPFSKMPIQQPLNSSQFLQKQKPAPS